MNNAQCTIVKWVLSIMIIFTLFIVNFTFAPPAQAQIPLTPIDPGLQDEIRQLARPAAVVGLGAQALADLDLRVYAMRLARRSLMAVGLIFIIMILYAGFLWMTSGGAEERVTKAKGILMTSTIGVFLILTSYAITTFVSRRFVRITFETALTSAQNCATDGGEATCCREWSDFQTESTSVPGLCQGATTWQGCGDEFGSRVASSRDAADRRYDEWRDCMDRARESIGL